jgi:uncharacterized membrane protein
MSAIVSGKEESVTRRTSNTERVGAFSDRVFAVIITLMVLELKPPEDPSFAALALKEIETKVICDEHWRTAIIRYLQLTFLTFRYVYLLLHFLSSQVQLPFQ